jgi:hypothetical protein
LFGKGLCSGKGISFNFEWLVISQKLLCIMKVIKWYIYLVVWLINYLAFINYVLITHIYVRAGFSYKKQN